MSETAPNRKKNNTVLYVLLAIITIGVITFMTIDDRRQAAEDAKFQEEAREWVERRNNPTPEPTPSPVVYELPASDTWLEPMFFAHNMLAVFNRGLGGRGGHSRTPLSLDYSRDALWYSSCAVANPSSTTVSDTVDPTSVLARFKNPIYDGVPYDLSGGCEPAHVGLVCIDDELFGIYWSGGNKIEADYYKPLRADGYNEPLSWNGKYFLNYDLQFISTVDSERRIWDYDASREQEGTWNTYHSFIMADNEFLILTEYVDQEYWHRWDEYYPDRKTFIEFLQNDAYNQVSIQHTSRYNRSPQITGYFNMVGTREAIQPVIDWCYHRTPLETVSQPLPEMLYNYDGPYNHRQDHTKFDGSVPTTTKF